ncbi:MAG: hypothetical protein ACYTBZ_18210 [Planctomycetota bacterium]
MKGTRMEVRHVLSAVWFWLTVVSMATAGAYKVEKKTVAFESLDGYITCELFDPAFLHGDCAYTALTSASDGKIYFSIGSHNNDYASRFFSFDPAAKKVTQLARMDVATGEDAKKAHSQGKIHTRIFEHKQKLWFATHTAFYKLDPVAKNWVPGTEYKGKTPYRGAHFMNYDLASGKFTSLVCTVPNEGMISMTMDKEAEVLYGLTWPSGLLLSYDIKNNDYRCWGPVQGRGGWGAKPFEWQMICRTLALEPNGFLYGSTMHGKVWKYDPTGYSRINYIEGLDLRQVPFAQSAEETLKGEFRHNWRTIEWNPKTESFWGLHFETSTLFEFVPSQNYIRAVANLGHEAYHGMPRNPEISQLGFTLGPKNTLFYLAHGPAVKIKDRADLQSNLYLITYDIDRAKYTNHGPILSAGKRRVMFAESIAIDPDGYIYCTAWVEVADPKRAEHIMAVRLEGAPEETQLTPYEMLLVRLPKWQTLLN